MDGLDEREEVKESLLKITGVVLVVLSGTMIGILLSDRLKTRVRLYEQMIGFLTQAQASIGYTAASAETLLQTVRGLPLLEPILRDSLQGLEEGKPLETAWCEAVRRCVSHPADRELFCRFGESFGTTDTEGELAKLLQKELVTRQYTVLQEELKSKRRLYRILGSFGGILTAVILW